MVGLMRSAAMSVSFLVLLSAIPLVDAQGPTSCSNPNVGCCGEIQLILLNPDLQPDGQGFINAAGQFFVQFQAIGVDANKIATFGFSFGAYTTQFPEDVCDLPSAAWFTGQQVLNYRADTDASDGFFINLQTGLVPDGRYTAALHAYDSSDSELARFWTSAIVANCDTAVDPAGQVERCGDDPDQLRRNDFIQPWPIVLPGDGLTPADVDGFTLEFAEELAHLSVFLNGENVTSQLEPWDGRLWDNDLKPGYGPNGLLGDTPLTQECAALLPTVPQVHDCTRLGVSYKWTQRTLATDDVLRVEAVDLAGNRAVKDLHIGSGVTSGAVSENIAVLEWTVDANSLTVEPGKTASFAFTITNRGGETGHPFADQSVPSGWDFQWDPGHVPVPSGESKTQGFQVTPPADAEPGRYSVLAFTNYTQSGQPVSLRQDLFVEVAPATAGPTTDPETDEGSEDSPITPLPLLGLALVGVAWARMRRT